MVVTVMNYKCNYFFFNPQTHIYLNLHIHTFFYSKFNHFKYWKHFLNNKLSFIHKKRYIYGNLQQSAPQSLHMNITQLTKAIDLAHLVTPKTNKETCLY